MRAYIPNRMSGVPQFNYPWFDGAARDELRHLEHLHRARVAFDGRGRERRVRRAEVDTDARF